MLEKNFPKNFRFLGSQAPQGTNIAHSTFAVERMRAGWWDGARYDCFSLLLCVLRSGERWHGRRGGAAYFMACSTWCSSRLVMPSSMFVWIAWATFSFVIICGMLTVLMDSIGIRSSLLLWNGM